MWFSLQRLGLKGSRYGVQVAGLVSVANERKRALSPDQRQLKGGKLDSKKG